MDLFLMKIDLTSKVRSENHPNIFRLTLCTESKRRRMKAKGLRPPSRMRTSRSAVLEAKA